MKKVYKIVYFEFDKSLGRLYPAYKLLVETDKGEDYLDKIVGGWNKELKNKKSLDVVQYDEEPIEIHDLDKLSLNDIKN